MIIIIFFMIPEVRNIIKLLDSKLLLYRMKAKKLAISREDALNGLIDAGKNSIEFSIIIKKSL